MRRPIPLRLDYDAAQLRRIARESEDADQVRRLLVLAAIYDGASRTQAAEAVASRCKWCTIGCCGSTRRAPRG